MLMRSLTVAAFLAGLSLAGQVHAGIIYNWVPIAGSPSIDSTAGMLELTDAATQGSGLNVDSNGFVESLPNSPILDLSITVNGKTLEILPRSNSSNEFSLAVALQYTNGGVSPAGSIFANNQESDVSLSGDSSLWMITRFGSDDPAAGEACFNSPGCSGATGRWELAGPAAASVPAPPVGLLFAAAVAALGFVSRRTRKH